MHKAMLFGLIVALVLVGCGIQLPPLRIAIEPTSPIARTASMEDNVLGTAGFEFEAVLVEPGSSTLAMLRNGEVDLGFLHSSVPYSDDLSVLLPVYRDVLHVFARENIQADDLVGLLTGRTVYVPGVASTEYQFINILKGNKSYRDFNFKVTFSRADNPDILLILAPLKPGQFGDTMRGFRLFSLADPDELGPGNPLEGVKYAMPMLETVIVPAGMYGPSYTRPLVTIGVDRILVGRSVLPGPLVYMMMKALVENKAYFTSLDPVFFEYLGQKPDPNDYNLPLHPGAWRYFNRDAPDFIERYAEVINMGMYSLVLLGSLAIGLYRWRRRQKKNRIDVFYADLLDIRERAHAGADVAALRAEVRDIEGRAFSMLIDEQLVADESMTIFLLQVQNLLNELDQYG